MTSGSEAAAAPGPTIFSVFEPLHDSGLGRAGESMHTTRAGSSQTTS
jgi:hypothetical protein